GPHISLTADPIFHIGSFPVTNSLFLATIIMVLFVALATWLRGRFKLVPSMIQNVFEMFIEALLDLMDSVLGERRLSEKYMPIVATIFLFVLFSNWFGLLPGVGSFIIGEHATPLLRAPSADLNFTLALAIISVISANLFGIGALGILKHASKFISFKNPIAFFIGIIELVSEVAKMISFSFRLFGNVFAGEVLLAIIAFLAPYVLPIPFLGLEVFVGVIQALIFSMLTIVFIAISIADHDDHAPEAAH
ncbi:MAG: F-type H+-transporting ATPase subunit a, partial [Patescibacteria group bacterium]|nr:F-type H+-transporting ATPase subunit a [Patescibacteria group bacterium]